MKTHFEVRSHVTKAVKRYRDKNTVGIYNAIVRGEITTVDPIKRKGLFR
jgi:hypothetical protein